MSCQGMPGRASALERHVVCGSIRRSEILATLVQQLRRTDAACGLRHVVFPLQPRSVESIHCRISQIRLGHHPSLRFKYYDAMPARCALSASRTRAYSQEAPRCGVSSWHLGRCDSCLRCKFVHVPCLLVLCARLFLTSPAAARYALTRAFQCFTQSARKTLQAVFQADMSGPGVSATSGA
ncbi:uncharacterized protein LOC144106255 [Amblyomma americanum]